MRGWEGWGYSRLGDRVGVFHSGAVVHRVGVVGSLAGGWFGILPAWLLNCGGPIP